MPDPVRLEFDPGTVVWEHRPPSRRAIDDGEAAIEAAIALPIGFPPLVQAVVPGDRVAVIMPAVVPCADALLRGLGRAFERAGVAADDVSILRDVKRLPAEGTPETDRGRGTTGMKESTHDPDDADQMAYLAANKAAQPIYLNRLICEADVVVPVGVLRSPEALQYRGVHSDVYPAFGDRAAIRRFQSPASSLNPVHRRRRRDEVDEVGWLLGLPFTIQVIRGPGDTLLSVLAGSPNSVAERGQEFLAQAWSFDATRQADLVIAAIDGDSAHQTWSNVCQALVTASTVCRPRGTMVLCTNLELPLGPSLHRLAGRDSRDELVHELQRDRGADALLATVLAELRDQFHIYLMSGCAADDVESLGIGYVENAAAIERLAHGAKSCILWSEAHLAIPRAHAIAPAQ